MRYATSQYGEYATALGEFTTGRSGIKIDVWNAATGASVTIGTRDCAEIGSTGVYRWSSSNITSQPEEYTEILFVMVDETPTVGTGRTQKGKIIVGGFPSDSAIRRFQQRVWIDASIVNTDTDFPNGTPEQPVSTVAAARVIANRENLKAYQVKGAISVTTDHEDWNFQGVDPGTDIVTFDGHSTARCQFTSVGIRGTLNGDIAAEKCLVGTNGGTLIGLAGTFTECGFDGTIRPQPYSGGHFIQGLNLASQSQAAGGSTCILDYNGVGCRVIGEFKGMWRVANMNTDDTSVLAVALAGAEMIFDATSSDGIVILLGYGEITDNCVAPSRVWFGDNVIRGSRVNQSWDGVVGTREVNQSNPAQWTLLVREGDDPTTTSHSFDLEDGDGNPISDANPLTSFIGARRR